MRFTLLLACFAIFGLFVTATSCTKDKNDGTSKDCRDFNYGDEWEKAYESLFAAITDYSNNPNTETCLKYVDAYKKYIRTMEGFEKCILPAQRDAWKKSLEESKAELDDVEC